MRLVSLGLLALVGVGILLLADAYVRLQVDADNERALVSATDAIADQIGGDMGSRINAVQNLQAFMLSGDALPPNDHFDRFAAHLLASHSSMRAFGLVGPDRILRHQYPHADSVTQVGTDLMQKPCAPFVEKAVSTRSLAINDPMETAPGIFAVIVRAPLFRGEELLGLVQGTVEVSSMVQSALADKDSRFGIQLRDAAGRLFSGPELPRPARTVFVPVGDNVWELGVFWHQPPAGPDRFIRSLIWLLGSALLASLLFMTNRAWTRQRWLAQAVTEKTAELLETNRQLAGEIGERRQVEEALRTSEEMLSKAFHASPLLISISTESGGRFLDVNEAWLRMSGYTREDVVGRTASEIGLWPDPRGREKMLRALAAKGAVRDFEVSFRTKSGDIRYALLNIERVSIKGEPCLLIVGNDVTDRRRSEREMRKLSLALEQTADAVMITDRNGVIEYVNPAFETTTGFRRDEVLGRQPSIVKSDQQKESFYAQLWSTILKGNVYRDVVVNRKKDGALYYEEKTITPLRDANGDIIHFISTGKDITERMQAQERLHYLAYHDVLTGLPNRALFMERLSHAVSRAHRSQRVLAVFFLDLDRFKVINDTLGHDVGDSLLHALSVRLTGCVREGDTVSRLGGDEFAVILEDVLMPDDISLVARKILSAFAQPFTVSGRELFVTTSIGVSVFPGDGFDARTLLKNADVAMYRAKEQGRNMHQFYAHEMGAEAVERLDLETSLRHALERAEFEIHYQAQRDIASGDIVGFEALLRWNHPELGLLPPAQFVPLLEETGLIIPVGEWVLRTACAQAKAWHDAGREGLRIAVNLSARQFADQGLAAAIRNAVETTGLEPALLELEITESVLMQNAPATVATLEAMTATGIRFAIDDFGTGYSSLSYLKRFPIDTLKIDRSFVHDIATDPDDAAIITTIVAMAHSLKLAVVAEGVETEEQLAFLRNCDCDAMQGYLFHRPAPVTEVSAMLFGLAVSMV